MHLPLSKLLAKALAETNRSKYKQCQRIPSFFAPSPAPPLIEFPPESNANKTESKEARSLCVFQRLLAKSQLNLCQHHGFYLFVVVFCFRFIPPFSRSLPLPFLSLALCRFFCAVFKCKLIKTIEGKQKLGGAKK